MKHSKLVLNALTFGMVIYYVGKQSMKLKQLQ